MRNSIVQYFLFLVLLLCSRSCNAAELQPETLQQWKQYIRLVDDGSKTRLAGGSKFLWIDEQPDKIVLLRQGKIQAEPVIEHGMKVVTHGLIHHWIGAVFIPNASVEDLLKVITDYDRYKEFYRPAVADSKVLERAEGEDRFSMRLVNQASIGTKAIDAQCSMRTVRVDEHRGYNISDSISLRDVRNFGKTNEYQLPPDQGDGFLWRLHSISRYEQRDGGLYVEFEVLALTRDIPSSLRWLVRPIVVRMSRNSLLISLGQTRTALAAGKPALLTSERDSHPR